MRAMSNCSAWNMLKRMGVEAADEFIKKPSVAAELNRDLRLPLLLSDNERWPERPDVKLHLIMQTFLLKPHHLKPSLQLTPLQSKYITVCILGFHFVALQTILLFLFFKTYRAKS